MFAWYKCLVVNKVFPPRFWRVIRYLIVPFPHRSFFLILECNIGTSANHSLNKSLPRVDFYLFTCNVKIIYTSFTSNVFFKVFRSLLPETLEHVDTGNLIQSQRSYVSIHGQCHFGKI